MTEKEPVRDHYAKEENMNMLMNSKLDDEIKAILLDMYHDLESLKLDVRNIRQKKPLTKSYLSSREVCSMLGISKRCLQNWRDQQKIPYQKLFGKIVYDKAAILQWMKKE